MCVFPANQNIFKSDVGRELNSKEPKFSGGGEEFLDFTNKLTN